MYVLQQVSLAVIAVTVLALSLSLLEAWLQPSRAINITLFFVLLAGVAGAIGFVIVRMQRMQQDDQFLAQYVDGRIPDLEQRLLTSLEFTSDDIENGRKGVSQQFIRQLWADAETHVHEQQQRVDQVVSSKTSWYSASSALAVVVVAMSALLLSDALLNAAGKLFWPFTPEPVAPVAVIEEPLEIAISVEPGDISMQRGDAATIVARVTNASPSEIQLRIQTDNVNWQDLTMQQDRSGSDSASYSYFMPSVQEDLVYYVNFVQNGEQRSEQFRISLYDLPKVEQIDLAYQYPQYTGIENNSEEDTGDMLVPEGTEVELQVTFNKNVETAVIEFQEGEAGYQSVPLTIDGNIGRASFTVAGDSVYRVVATDFEDLVSQDPLDYYIRSIPDQPPELVLKSPGQDQDVMPLEEVVLEVEANDDYGLSEFNLHYAVVGADEVAVDFLPPEQTRSIAGNELIYLEDLAVAPGDFVSYYLTLADNNGLTGPAAVVSDIYFLQVIPTDQEFRRAGGGGGGGGGGGQGGGESSALVTLQKDIIAATWKLRNQQINADPATFATDVQIIAESQRDATARARQSIDRLAERLNFSDDSYDSAVLNLQQAIEQMTLAIAELDKQQITSALKPEQVALQFILKAEADINRTDVSTEQQAGGGGGGGGAQQEREDLRELFEMEMGQLENRYETPQSAGGGGGGQQTEEANKLEELARRQEGLTRAQRDLARRMEAMNEEQRRRELERLQREQEQLSQEVAQLAQQLSRGQQGQQSQQSQQRQQGQQSQSQQGPQPGSAQGSSQGQSQQASAGGGSATGGQNQNQSQLERAAQQMQDAAQADSPAQAAARSQRALESLREQQRQMAAEQNTSVNQLAQNAAQRGEQLLQQQRQLQQDLQTANREQGLGTTRQDARSSEELQELIAAQQAQRREIEEIEKMLRAIIARGENEDQQLLSQAQQASRAIRPIREEMDTSGRVLSNGMVNLAVDIEQEIGDSLDAMNAALQAMNSANTPASSDPIQQAARNAAELMQQMQELERQALALNQGDQSHASIAQMRQQLERSQQLAQDLATQLQQQQMEERTAARRGANAQSQPGQQLAQGQPGQDQQAQGQQGQGGQGQQGGQQGQTGQGGSGANQQPGNQQAGNQPGSSQTPGQNGGFGGDGRPAPTGGSNALGNARSIRSELTSQGIEDFLSQPELFAALLQPIMELEAELRAQAEMDRINQKLYASADEDVPDQYRRLVEEYYRVLSETNGADAAAP
ncbi:MAG: hypothetical protein A3H44_02070 [Gammaproteobacteria bacterium RIFCSPLOWO2_02_FULL_57_10]|nr:MAG: hypothetical protein A3H44_02070 [Gammaproteobacteria bacterium RIFCSPLOWO2_02_FULL_57_10]